LPCAITNVEYLIMRVILLLTTLTFSVAAWQSQDRHPILRRWVGTLNSQPLHFDFFGDTMLLLNDTKPLSFRLQGDSLTAWGSDTTFTVRYWFSRDRLLVLTAESTLVTMAEQSRAARPLWGLWRGSPIGKSDEVIELVMRRGGTALYRVAPSREWLTGEWNRATRMISFTWEADSTEWVGQFDPGGAALLFDSTYAESGTVVLRKVYR
jgi:hypothetical protein